ncbi:flagella basal body P-ring formation protein FlgA [Lysobacteraceae bacterium NML93-0399]|nr:flagella basal body P-ring formation protein FlgA [Xanthomonadaceae bacterium NML93-0399]
MCPGLVAASGFQAVESIRAAALSTFAGEGPDAAVAEAHLDPALRMPQCDQALEARRSSAATVEVSCPTGWRLFVPVKVQRSQSVLVLTRNVASGETITADLFMAERRDTARIAGAAIAEPAQAVGRSARRMLAAGSVLTTGDLESPRVVRRGDTIALVSRQGGIEVRMEGRALADAGVDERVRVENLSSRRVVQGVAGADGSVLVGR